MIYKTCLIAFWKKISYVAASVYIYLFHMIKIITERNEIGLVKILFFLNFDSETPISKKNYITT